MGGPCPPTHRRSAAAGPCPTGQSHDGTPRTLPGETRQCRAQHLLAHGLNALPSAPDQQSALRRVPSFELGPITRFHLERKQGPASRPLHGLCGATLGQWSSLQLRDQVLPVHVKIGSAPAVGWSAGPAAMFKDDTAALPQTAFRCLPAETLISRRSGRRGPSASNTSCQLGLILKFRADCAQESAAPELTSCPNVRERQCGFSRDTAPANQDFHDSASPGAFATDLPCREQDVSPVVNTCTRQSPHRPSRQTFRVAKGSGPPLSGHLCGWSPVTIQVD